MEDIQASSRMLNELKTVVGGLRISIDDFGTGYSSLYYLKSFLIDLLKIDRSFVRDIVTDPDDGILVAAMIRLAHDLGIEVIAEGVETGERLAYLRERGCDEVQGFYCGRPLPPMSSSSCWRGEDRCWPPLGPRLIPALRGPSNIRVHYQRGYVSGRILYASFSSMNSAVMRVPREATGFPIIAD
jgi:predicted signal transduction protein with EAL and GGDEF domain